MLANGQNQGPNTDKSTDTRLPAAVKPLIIQRFLTLAKVALRRPRRRAQRQATERMAMRASCPARFVTPAPRGHGQRRSLSSTIIETAISG
jgi:hypothetical protein